MKIKSQKSDLLNSVNIVLKAVSVKSTMPILESLVIEAADQHIRMIANDMELGIETKVEGTVIEPGMVALNAKIFSEIIRRLPENEVDIITDDNFVTNILCEKSKFSISGISGEDFPFLPEIEREKALEISQFTLKELIRQTVFQYLIMKTIR